MTSGEHVAPEGKSWLQVLYDKLVGQPVERWYLRSIESQFLAQTDLQRISLRRQAIAGWLQTLLLIIVVAQSLFAGVLRVLPPDIRTAVGFLHRIEWSVYAGIILIAVQVALSWRSGVLLTNRFYLLAWRFGKPRIIRGDRNRGAQIGYIVLSALLILALIWVRINGFVVQPAR